MASLHNLLKKSVTEPQTITFHKIPNASEVKTNSKNNRSYHALEEVGIQPNIFYMTKVRNTESNEA